MEERSVANGIIATILSVVTDFCFPLRWFFLAALILIIADLRFGIRASRKRGEEIRFSRAIRRSTNKVVDYLCWIMLAGTIGQAFGGDLGIKIMPSLILVVIYGIEINSCFSNYFEAHGKKIRFNIFDMIKNKEINIEEVEK